MFRNAIFSVIAVLLAASPALAAKVNLPGQVTYREHVALPDAATLRIQLVDESLAGAPARLDVQGPIGQGQVPLSFSLTFDDSIVIPDHRYALIASIGAAGHLMFRNFEPYAVNPLAPEAPVLIVTGLIGQPAAAPASSAEPESAAAAEPAILDTVWTAAELGKTPIPPRSRPSLTIGSDLRAGGSGGCNSWFAQAELDGDSIRFGGVTSTRKACADPVNQAETAYFAALAATATWQIDGDELWLLGADGKPQVKFTR